MIKISVIIPAYNVENYIDKCFKSLLSQTFKDFEVIAINDGSKDYTFDKMKKYELAFQNIQIIDKLNEGVGATRNLGIELSKGEYILFVDPDDYLHPKMLEVLYEKAIQTTADVSVCDFYECYEQTAEQLTITTPIESEQLIVISDEKDILFKITPAPWNKLIKAKILKERRILFPLDYRSEDLNFTPKLLANCQTLAVVHQPLYYYLSNRINNVTSTYDERILHTRKALEEVMEYYISEGKYDSFKYELEMLVIKQIQYELRKVIHIKDKALARQIILEFYQFIEGNFPTWRKNKYYRRELKRMTLLNRYRTWIYEKPVRLRMYYSIRQLRRLFK